MRMKKFAASLSGLALVAGLSITVASPASAGYIYKTGTYAWGGNSYGGLGVGNTTTQRGAALIKGLENVVVADAATSSTHSLLLDDEGNLYASGNNSQGALGTGTTTSSTVPVKVALPLRYGVPDYATRVWVGENVSFMRGSYGDLYAWGSNARGLTGQGKTTGTTLRPQKVDAIDYIEDHKRSLSVSSTHVLGINTNRDTSETYMTGWGDNSLFALGRSEGVVRGIVSNPTKVVIDNPNEDPTISKMVCDTAGSGDCSWQTVPKTYDEFSGIRPEMVASGDNFSVAYAEGKLYTWGINTKGQLGRNLSANTVDSTAVTSPALLLENYAGVVDIDAGKSHAIALSNDGLLYGWGDNSKSQTAPYYAGTGSSYLNVLQRLTIAKSDNGSWTSIGASDNTSYGLVEGAIYGWGSNANGQLVNLPSVVSTPTRMPFPHATNVTGFDVGGDQVVAFTDYTINYDDFEIATPEGQIASGAYNTAYNFQLKSKGGYPGNPITWTIADLPKGLVYNSKTGVISGKPLTAGEFDIYVGGSDNVVDDNSYHTIKIAKSTPSVNSSYRATGPGTGEVTVKVEHAGIPASGSVVLSYGSSKPSATLNNGTAVFKVSGTPGNSLGFTANYAGNSVLNAASGSTSGRLPSKTAAVINASYVTKSPGKVTASIAVTVAGKPANGQVVVKYGSLTSKAVTLKNGKAVFTVNTTAGKNVSVRAVYLGTSTVGVVNSPAKTIKVKGKYSVKPKVSYKASKGKVKVSVKKISSSGATASGKVTIYDGKKKIATKSLKKGALSVTIKAKKGTHKFSVKYTGNANFAASTSKTAKVKVK